MELDMTHERLQAHALLDMLPDGKLNVVRSLLEVMVEPGSGPISVEPMARSLARAPSDDQELSPETAASLDCARASLARGEGISHDEILREFGLN